MNSLCSQSVMAKDGHINTIIKLDYSSRPFLIPGATPLDPPVSVKLCC